MKFIFPEEALLIDTAESFVEAYCVYCFYKMQIYYIGSRENVLETLRNSTANFGILNGLERKYPNTYWWVCEKLLLQFLFFRPLYSLALGILDRKDNKPQIFALFTILQLLSLIFGMIGLLRITFVLSAHTRRLVTTWKLIFLKGIILMIVLENLLTNILIQRL